MDMANTTFSSSTHNTVKGGDQVGDGTLVIRNFINSKTTVVQQNLTNMHSFQMHLVQAWLQWHCWGVSGVENTL